MPPLVSFWLWGVRDCGWKEVMRFFYRLFSFLILFFTVGMKYLKIIIKVTSRRNWFFHCGIPSSDTALPAFLCCLSSGFGSCPDGIASCLPPFNPVPLFSPLRFQLYRTEKRSSDWHFIYKVNSRDCVFLIFKLELAHKLLVWVQKHFCFNMRNLTLSIAYSLKRIGSCSFMKKYCVKSILNRD